VRNMLSIPGWFSKRKLIVIESDDWGSVRMPSGDAFKILQQSGIDLLSDEGSVFNKYDSLATIDDLAGLFEVLSSVKDRTGRHAVLTPVSVVANPDFHRIRESGFYEYYYEPITTTLGKYKGCESSFQLWKEGINKRLFVPQFHGREHLNVSVWLKALQNNNRMARQAFDLGCWGISTADDPEIGVEFQAAFDYVDSADLACHKEILISGLEIFKDLFGYHASYFVAPNGLFSSSLETVLANLGIKYVFMPKIQSEPVGGGKIKKRIHWLGKRLHSNLTVLTRNCFFEPSQPGKDWIDTCLSDISISFKWHKPAIISSHRVNFIGALSVRNRENGLFQLRSLLKTIMTNWPETEFITSEELGKLIHCDKIDTFSQ